MTSTSPQGDLGRHGEAVAENGYYVIPIRRGGKSPGFDGWEHTPLATPALIQGWLSDGHRKSGVGILTKYTPAVDIDVLDEFLVAKLVTWISENIAPDAPQRIGKRPKTLLLFQCDRPFNKVMSALFRKPTDDPHSRGHRVEILGDGQQFVAFHIHPETFQPYKWTTKDTPLNVPALDLPILTHEQAVSICHKFEEFAEAEGWVRVSQSKDTPRSTDDSPEAALLDEDPPEESEEEVERVKSALESIKLPRDYFRWRDVLFALKWTGWKCAEELARTWSEKHDDHDSKEFRGVWRGAEKREGGKKITLATLYSEAKRFGWDSSRKRSEEEEKTLYEELMTEVEFLSADDHQGASDLLKQVVEAKLNPIAEEQIIKAIKDTTKIAVGAIRKGIAEARKADDKATHANYAIALLADIKSETDCDAVGVEGKLWKYSASKGVWVGRIVVDYEVEVARLFDGKDHCERRSDYVAIATHAHAIASENQEEFFNEAPVGLACERRFYSLTGRDDDKPVDWTTLGPEHRQRVLSPVRPIVGEMPLWLKFLDETFDGEHDEEQIELLQEVMGAVALGVLAKYEKVVMFKGPGRSGKGTVTKVIEQFVHVTNRSAISPFRWDSEYYLANLAGSRLNIVGELPDDEPLPAAHFKSVTGRDMLTGRHPTHRPFNFRNTASHIFSSNHYVYTKDQTEAFYTRWLLLEFRNSRIGMDDMIDVNLAEKIVKTEMPAILAWALQGAKRLVLRGHFKTTRAQDKLMDEWRRRTSTVIEFLRDTDECGLGQTREHVVRRSAFYDAYARWCRESNRRPFGKQRLYDELDSPAIRRMGIKFAKLAGNTVLLRGVMLRAKDHDAWNEEPVVVVDEYAAIEALGGGPLVEKPSPAVESQTDEL